MLQIIINIILTFSLLSLVGISFYFVFNTSKYYAIHHASIIALGGYFLSLFSKLSFPLFWSAIISLIFSIFIGITIQKLILIGNKRINIKSFFLIIISLGIYISIQNLISIFFGDELIVINNKQLSDSIQINTAYITNTQMLIIITNLIVIITTLLLFNFSILGKKIKAVSNNNSLSKLFGINTDGVILWSFGIGSLLAAISGILITLDVGMDNYSSFNLLFYAVIAIIIGGIGSFKGLIYGALILSISQNLTAYYFDSKWVSIISYLILIIFLLWKPYGFSGKKLKKAEI